MQQGTTSGTSRSNGKVGRYLLHLDGGISGQVSDTSTVLSRLYLKGFAEGGQEFSTKVSRDSARSVQQQLAQSREEGRQLSSCLAVTREAFGARVAVEVTIESTSDVAFSITNLEITALATDPQDRTRFVPVATLVPESTLLGGVPALYNLGPSTPTRTAVLFASRDIYVGMVEDRMRNPRGLSFEVVNYDILTEDGRNFAFGSQLVQDRTAGVSFDFGDGRVERHRLITAAVLDHPRDELRCAPSGDHPYAECETNSDCGSSLPCAPGTITGGFSEHGGTGAPAGVPLDFLLQDILHLTKAETQLASDFGRITVAPGDSLALAFVQDIDRDGLLTQEEYVHGSSDLRQDTAPCSSIRPRRPVRRQVNEHHRDAARQAQRQLRPAPRAGLRPKRRGQRVRRLPAEPLLVGAARRSDDHANQCATRVVSDITVQ